MKENIKKPLSFGYIGADNIELPQIGQENNMRNGTYVHYGNSNRFPQDLLDLYYNCSLFSSIVTAITNYVASFDLDVASIEMEETVKKCVFDYVLFGGFALQINQFANTKRVHYVDFANCRRSKDRKTVYYSRTFSKYTRSEVLEFPAYIEGELQPKSILYVAPSVRSSETYPHPMAYPAIPAIYTLTQITNFWRASLDNNLSPSAMIVFKNGIPDEDTQREIEKKINDKFSGTNNAGKLLLMFADDDATAPSIERITEDNFDEKYRALVETVRDEVYQAFQINPILLGKNSSNGGFNTQEFAEAFSLFYVTKVLPIQRTMENVFKSLGVGITFTRFHLDDEGNVTTVDNSTL